MPAHLPARGDTGRRRAKLARLTVAAWQELLRLDLESFLDDAPSVLGARSVRADRAVENFRRLLRDGDPLYVVAGDVVEQREQAGRPLAES